MPDERSKWIRINESSAKRYLAYNGYSSKDGETFSEVDRVILEIQQKQNVEYAAKLAGYDAGFYSINGNHILVTESLKLIEPKAGDWPLLRGIIDGMLNVEGVDQRPYFYAWLKVSLTSIRSRNWTPGQVLAFAGPKESAKSLIQSIITEILGGRSAKPYLFMTGRTNFNSDMFQGEHLMVEDDCEYTDIKSRRHFGSEIKKIAVNSTHQCHGKNKDALILTPWWRMTISLNDDPERLLVLPPIQDDIDDKIMLFKIAKKEMPMPTESSEQRKLFWNALKDELPAFIDFALNYEIPQHLRSSRFGIKCFHHPDVLLALEETSTEIRFLELVDKEIFKADIYGVHRQSAREFTALDLETVLTGQNSNVAREARKLLYYDKACGTYLGRLAKRPGSRVSKRLLRGDNRWTIQPPQGDDTTESPGDLVKRGGWVDTILKSNVKKVTNPKTEKVEKMDSKSVEQETEVCIHPSTTSDNCPRPPVCVQFAEGHQSLTISADETALAAN